MVIYSYGIDGRIWADISVWRVHGVGGDGGIYVWVYMGRGPRVLDDDGEISGEDIGREVSGTSGICVVPIDWVAAGGEMRDGPRE